MQATLTSTSLSPEEVAKHLEAGLFEDQVSLEPVEEGALGGSALAGEIPLSEREGPTGYLLMERGTAPSSLPGSEPHGMLGLSLFTCRTPVCVEAQEAAEDSLGENRRLALPPGASVSDVRYGDANADGQTDILVVLSTGAGFLFEQNPGVRAHTPPPRPAAPRPSVPRHPAPAAPRPPAPGPAARPHATEAVEGAGGRIGVGLLFHALDALRSR